MGKIDMDIIKDYLNSYYQINIDDYFDGHAHDLLDNNYVYKSHIIGDLINIFNVNPMLITELVDKWWEEKRLPFVMGEIEFARQLNNNLK